MPNCVKACRKSLINRTVNAHDLEHLVSRTIAELLLDQPRLLDAIGNKGFDATTISEIFNEARFAAAKLTNDAIGARKDMLEQLKPSITLQLDRIDIALGIQTLAALLGVAMQDDVWASVELRCDAVRVRQGREVRLVISDESISPPSNCDTKLVALLAEAQAAAKLLSEYPGQSLSAVAKQHGRCRTRLGKLVELSCLAPDIITAIVSGEQPAQLDSKALAAANIPMDWAGQRKLLGFRQNR